MNSKSKKVLSPIETEPKDGGEKKTFWMRVGTAFVNKDGSTNVYLDAVPRSMKLQIRDFDERDLAARSKRDDDGARLTQGTPF